jgi:hypothetical protein
MEEQRRYLLRVSQDFSVLMKAAVDGVYNHPFFGSATSEEGYHKRLRAVVQNRLTDFEDTIRRHGEALSFVPSKQTRRGPNEITRGRYLELVEDLMRRSRGRELPGTFNPLIIGELFTEQCEPWKDLAAEVKDDIVQAVYRATQAVLDHVAVAETADGIFRIISGGIEGLKTDLNDKVAELLEPHYNGHPITYNHYLIENVKKAQADRQRRELEKTLAKYFDTEDMSSKRSVIPQLLLQTLVDQRTNHDMERYASELAVDYMQAYYKVSL